MSYDIYANSTRSIAKNKVLKNTYLLLAASMVPTVLGAFVGLQTGIYSVFATNPLIAVIAFFAIAYGFIFAISKNANSGIGIALMLGFTFFMGLMLSGMLASVLTQVNGAQIIMAAAGGTATIFLGMSFLATVIKKDLSGWSNFLIIGVLLLIVGGIANIWLRLPMLSLAISYVATVIFSIFLIIDTQRIVNGGETNYIRATLSIYINLYNIFSSLLNIFRS